MHDTTWYQSSELTSFPRSEKRVDSLPPEDSYCKPSMSEHQATIGVAFSNSAEKELVQKAARLVSMTPSAFLRELALKRAGEVVTRLDLKEMKRRINASRKQHLKVIDGGRK